MSWRVSLPVLLLLAAVSTGCQLNRPSPHFAPDDVSWQVNEAAAGEINQPAQQPVANAAQHAVPNTAMGY